MTETEVKYSGKAKDGSEFKGEVKMDFPDTVNEAVESYGEAAVFDCFCASLKIDAQRICRANHPEAQPAVDSWTPGVKRARAGGVSIKSMVEMIKADPELLKMLKARADAAAVAEGADAPAQ